MQLQKGGMEISGDEEITYITNNINDKIIKIIDLYYNKVALNSQLGNPELYFDAISTELNIDKCIVEYVFNIQFEFLKSKGIAK